MIMLTLQRVQDFHTTLMHKNKNPVKPRGYGVFVILYISMQSKQW